jgi:hypothetical protein
MTSHEVVEQVEHLTFDDYLRALSYEAWHAALSFNHAYIEWDELYYWGA